MSPVQVGSDTCATMTGRMTSEINANVPYSLYDHIKAAGHRSGTSVRSRLVFH